MDETIRRYIIEAKKDLRARQDVEAAFAKVRDAMEREVAAIFDEEAKAGSAIPSIDFEAVKADKVSDDQRAQIRRRGA